ncbi:hypothetical protein L6452_18549 [Arctium lappa]|uniref:Uncharacterized protein n=1 Tax=Arctium lappa TaxID=4217 RepID=A0ACB9C6H2_ARCLA|nr:hypothetical protein L6452_18549 [Arctium lappa]
MPRKMKKYFLECEVDIKKMKEKGQTWLACKGLLKEWIEQKQKALKNSSKKLGMPTSSLLNLSKISKSKPLVHSIGEYAQRKRRMTQFLNHKNPEYMKSITKGPVNTEVTVQGQATTDTSPEIPVRFIPKLYQYFSKREKEIAKIDEEALIYLTMAIPNDIYNRVYSRDSEKETWDELERQFQGTERSIQAKLNQSINAFEGFHAKEGEALIDT